MRWRRLKSSIIGALRTKALRVFLTENLSYDQYQKKFEDALAKLLGENLKEGQTREDARRLARHCAKNSSEAVDAVNDILTRVNLDDMDAILKEARAEQADELAQDFMRHAPGAVKLVDKLLAEAAVSIDDLTTEEIHIEMDLIERLDRLTTIAETRRNASLREIDRRRTILGEAVRRTVQEIEHDEFKKIELRRQKDAA